MESVRRIAVDLRDLVGRVVRAGLADPVIVERRPVAHAVERPILISHMTEPIPAVWTVDNLSDHIGRSVDSQEQTRNSPSNYVLCPPIPDANRSTLPQSRECITCYEIFYRRPANGPTA